MKHFAVAVSAVALLTGLWATPAFAHTTLSDSNIVSGSEIVSVPDTLELTFAKAVGLAAVDLEMPDGSETALKTPRSMDKAHSVSLPRLSPGRYSLTWRAVASDGHVMSGEITFTVLAK